MERRVAGQRDLVEGLLFGLIASGCVLAEGIEFSCIIFAFFALINCCCWGLRLFLEPAYRRGERKLKAAWKDPKSTCC